MHHLDTNHGESFSNFPRPTRDHVNRSSDNSGVMAIRRPTYWLEMRGIKTATDSMPAKKNHQSEEEEEEEEEDDDDDDEDYEEPSSKKRKHSGWKKRASTKKSPKRKGSYVPKEPPSYPAGSIEEKWYLEILHNGQVTCPKCSVIVRKTVEGLKKHMESCREDAYTCQHCGKKFRSSAGMTYHLMAFHNLFAQGDTDDLNNQPDRGRLRKVLKCMGRLKCMRKGCSSSFTTMMGYLYHTKKCGKEEAELEVMALKCQHCGRAYQSRAGLVYHVRTKHEPLTSCHGDQRQQKENSYEARVQRRSAKIASYYLHEIASEELIKEWPKRKLLRDLVPDDRKLKFRRPGLPTFSKEVLQKWNVELKRFHIIHCPNEDCEAVYSSIPGLKAHLGTCSKGDFVSGKYVCLLCEKEFVSESGVKYHINTVHSEEWFIVNTKSTKSFEKPIKMQQKNDKYKTSKAAAAQNRQTRSTRELIGNHSMNKAPNATAKIRSVGIQLPEKNDISTSSGMKGKEPRKRNVREPVPNATVIKAETFEVSKPETSTAPTLKPVTTTSQNPRILKLRLRGTRCESLPLKPELRTRQHRNHCSEGKKKLKADS
ncbi:zinc finger protein 512 [Microcaecilia unicolor]|uniref:Zinc finger protein 512 n=1 Tax=Microcaecilia unicolor TaxID=1415580 RepID=A0A6P7XPH4_9AMPH|nr:zinc finger protein 512 [Microcaecilia unicolor]XP_030054437.1 zinc finger protein 512 [Microcaecilia unicolor]XP_030054438.1 zinc finger protein 512 [Microcaecilia unicolor]XP_030054439.1 zinc finger protein 512 [Microcaecilia unicolor]